MAYRYYIGTSGWQYSHWDKRFYPQEISKKKWLGFYAKNFNSVEVNGTFYGPIKRKTFESWHRSVPRDFKFTLKGSRWITHMKKLSGVDKAVKKFYSRAEPLKRKLGCILWQLPPNLNKDLKRLDSFCRTLDNRKNNVIEFRDRSWFDKDTYSLLRERGVGFCIVSAPGLPEDIKLTSDILYVRFHGKRKWYTSLYSEREMKKWARKIKYSRAERVYCYFNNDARAYAIKNARMIREDLNARAS